MPETILQQKIYPYDGGMNSNRHPALIAATDIVDADNIVYTNYSTKKLRPGITESFTNRLGGNRNILYGIDYWRLGSQRVVYYDGERIWAATPGGVKDDISGSFEIPRDEVCSMTAFAGLLMIFFADGATTPKKWTMTGNITDLSDDAPAAAFGRVWLNSLWVPDPSVPGRILKSNTGDPTDFTTGDAQAIDLDINDGDPEGITAIFPPAIDGNFYVAKRLSLYKITASYDSADELVFSPKRISEVGCLSHNAVVQVGGIIIFPSDDGVQYLKSSVEISGVEIEPLSFDVQTQWVSDTNFRRAKYMQATYDNTLKSYLLIFPSVGRNYPNNVWGYGIKVGKWYRWRNYNQTSIFKYIDFNTKRKRTLVGSRFGDFGYIDVESHLDYDQRFSVTIQSGIIAPTGTPNDRYTFKALSPVFSPQITGNFEITYKIDGRTIETLEFPMTSNESGDELGEEFTTGQSVLGGLPRLKLDTRTINGTGTFYELIVSYDPTNNSDSDEDFELLGFLVDVDRVNKVVGEVSA